MNTSIGSHGAIPTRKFSGKCLFLLLWTLVDPAVDTTDAEIKDTLLECFFLSSVDPSIDILSDVVVAVVGRVADAVVTSLL